MAEAVIADYRYGFISSLLRDGVLVRLQDMHARIQFSDRMDKVLTHPFMGPAIMLGVLYLLYTVTFTIGEIPMGWVEQGFALLREGADAVLPDGPAQVAGAFGHHRRRGRRHELCPAHHADIPSNRLS